MSEGAGLDRAARLAAAIDELERRFGPGVVRRLAEARPKLGARAVPTGSLGLDAASGVGGVPRGRLSAVDGPESSGKSTLAGHVLASAQADGGLAALVDAEHSADAEELRACGVDLAGLVLGVPASAAEALAMAEILAGCAALDAVVVSPPPRPGSPALLAEAGRRCIAALAGTPTALLLVGLGGPAGRAPAPPFASLAVRLRLVRPILQSGGAVVGLRVRAEVVRNKLAPAGRAAEFDVLAGRGIHRAAELLDLGLALGLVEREAQGAVYRGCLLGRGRAREIAGLERAGELAAELEAEVRRALGLELAAPGAGRAGG